jgi:nucleoside-triphosphatase THEP1
MAKIKDITSESEEEKFAEYEKIGIDAQNVRVREHRNGFPFITIAHKEKDIYLETDILSLEKWFSLKRMAEQQGRED